MFDIVAISIFIILTRVFYDARYLNKHGLKHWLMVFGELLAVQSVSMMNGYYWEGLVVYSGIRAIVFDPLFGKVFMGDWFYLGNTSTWDKNKKKMIDFLKSKNGRIISSIITFGIVCWALITVLGVNEIEPYTLWGAVVWTLLVPVVGFGIYYVLRKIFKV